MASRPRTPATHAQAAPSGAALAEACAMLPELLRPLAERGVVREFAKDERVIQEGERGDELYIILAGRLRSCARNDKGREITYGIYGPGAYLGEMSLDGGPRSASVVAVEATRCVMVTRQTLLAHIREQPEFALEFIGNVIKRARAATESARDLALSDAYARLKHYLESFDAQRRSAADSLPSHREIASHVGCSREMVTRLLADLSAGGYLADPPGQPLLRRALPPRW